MDISSELYRARLYDPTSERSLSISSMLNRDITDAMRRVKKCAEAAMLSNVGFGAFMDSLILFKKDQSDGTIKTKVRDALKAYFDDAGVVCYIAEWQPRYKDALHYLPKGVNYHSKGLKALDSEDKVQAGNVFLFDKVILSF